MHCKVYDLTPDQFKEDTLRAKSIVKSILESNRIKETILLLYADIDCLGEKMAGCKELFIDVLQLTDETKQHS